MQKVGDNSAGGEVWVSGDQWGALKGQMLHLSYGDCSMLLVLREQVDGQAQGGVVPLPGRFLSGVMRGVFSDRRSPMSAACADGRPVRRGMVASSASAAGGKIRLPIGLSAHALACA
jgi:hypothetical protein